MRIITIAIATCLFFRGIADASPPHYASGLPTLDAFLKIESIAENYVVLGMTGFYGQDQPAEWLILASKDPNELEEFVVNDGKILGKRKVRRLPNQDLPSIPIPVSRLGLDSVGAFRIVEKLAQSRNIGYDSVHYQLRSRAQNLEPVWMVNLLDPAGRSIGVHYISAEDGSVLRSVWHERSFESLSNRSNSEDDTPVRMVYGGKVTEITVSGKVDREAQRKILRNIEPISRGQ